MSLRSFVADFLNTESYNAYYEPISNHISIFLIIAVIVVVAISITLIVLLRYKKKPWKIYLIPIFEYILMLGVLILTGTITINSNAVLIGSIPTIFAWLLVVFGGLALIYAVYPFFKPAFPEIKRVTWLKGKKYFADILRVFIFIVILALLFLLYQYFITEALAKIMG